MMAADLCTSILHKCLWKFLEQNLKKIPYKKIKYTMVPLYFCNLLAEIVLSILNFNVYK